MSNLKNMSLGKKIAFGFVGLLVVGAVNGGGNSVNKQQGIDASKNVNQTSSVDVSKQQTINTVETKTETKTEVVPFTSSTVNDTTVSAGTTKTSTVGVNGERTITYKVTYTNGKETARVESSNIITTQPVNEVIKNGTKKATASVSSSSCDPNYSGCVPIASDVDCAGGSGNGPAYVAGPINVIGSDIYGLDRDGNGIACE